MTSNAGETIGWSLVIETQCNYFAPLAFPQTVEAGIRVARLGGSSVRYEVGLFAQGESSSAAAGHFIHVYVDPPHAPASACTRCVARRAAGFGDARLSGPCLLQCI